jgi:hypothetical protein
MLLGVWASDVSDPLMVGYLLELLWDAALAGPTMLMRRASTAGFRQMLPPPLPISRDAPEDEGLDVPAEG